ncbi:hypothetical protein EVAR_92277_1 [Eumeta japonica]|uniref:Uncharacterized protein n=1 Tax=Eumeta variegata TaxID=151549 RepID=A0A4C1TMG5_EUMVA|nr:hypothetical protein EVAR_92277_1 [Eumeta japonica]
MGYPMEGDQFDGRKRGRSGPPDLSLIERNVTAKVANSLVEPHCLCVESHNSYLTRRRVKHLSLTQYSGKEAPSDVALRPVRAPVVHPPPLPRPLDPPSMISENRRNVEDVGIDYEVLQNYMARMSPILSDVDGRIQISNPCLV